MKYSRGKLTTQKTVSMTFLIMSAFVMPNEKAQPPPPGRQMLTTPEVERRHDGCECSQSDGVIESKKSM